MKTFNDLLAEHPDLRYRRTISATLLRRLLRRDHGECTWCGGFLPPRRTSWCSEKCLHEFRLRTDSRLQSQLVWERDGYTCQLCQMFIPFSESEFHREWKLVIRDLLHRRAKPSEIDEARRFVMAKHGFAAVGFGEIDHIVPVCEGGGLCGIDNLRLLCSKCHRHVTHLLSVRIQEKIRS